MTPAVRYEWRRVALERGLACGSCNGISPKGHPMLLVTIAGVDRTRWRCGACATALGQSVPADLPRLGDADVRTPPQETTRADSLTPLRALVPPAFKRKAHAR